MDSLRFVDLIDEKSLQRLLDCLNSTLGIANAVIDVHGTVIARAGWQDVCVNFHRSNPTTCNRCIESDTSLVESMLKGDEFAVYNCLNGLVDTAAPIIVEGQHLANIFTGQFFTSPPDLEKFRTQAEEFDFDVKNYLEAIQQVPIIPTDQVEAITLLFSSLANTLATNGIDRLIARKAEEKLRNSNQKLAQLVTERTKDLDQKNRELLQEKEVLKDSEQRFRDIANISADWIWELDENAHFTYASKGVRELLGYAPDDLIGNSVFDLMNKDEAIKIRQKFNKIAKQRKSFRKLENINLDIDGNEHVMMSSGVPVYDNEGNFKGYRGVDRDITEQNSMVRDLVRQAHFDYLTGVYSRGHFMELAESELKRAKRYNHEISVLILDVDLFKGVNDRYGHKAGDHVLIELAQTCKKTLRHIDIFGRIGGEEFAALLPETDKDKAIELAERLRRTISNTQIKFDNGLEIQCTVSIGVTHLFEKETSLDELLVRTDRGLYEAKETGRNKVCSA